MIMRFINASSLLKYSKLNNEKNRALKIWIVRKAINTPTNFIFELSLKYELFISFKMGQFKIETEKTKIQ